MALTFIYLSAGLLLPATANNTAYLLPDGWDDFGYRTLFTLLVFDERGTKHSIGNVKIGYNNQVEGCTRDVFPPEFPGLGAEFFSLGQDADYYTNIIKNLSQPLVKNLLIQLGDVCYTPERLALAESGKVFHTSLLRSVNYSSINEQFRRILNGEAALTEYNFIYEKKALNDYSGVKVSFQVKPDSKPPTNIHILIGRNGVGKTTILNNMVDALIPNRSSAEKVGFFTTPGMFGEVPLPKNYFAGVVSVSFSAFDPFTPPDDLSSNNDEVRYHYIGLKKRARDNIEQKSSLKDDDEQCLSFTCSLSLCLSLSSKRRRWINAVMTLESDLNFADMNLCNLVNVYDQDSSGDKAFFNEVASKLFNKMSSGHAIVLLTLTKLTETVEEKTLVLIDEPESHLHPPLLAAFTRALSDLLMNRNGLAIIATHSPVVLQEVPKSCVWLLRRTRLESIVDRPDIETFSENVGVLTREVFGLEVSKSGFHDLLTRSVNNGQSYEQILSEYGGQLGFEGKAILRSMVLSRATTSGRR